jgi:glycosyltransferase involved in cell wall biosynthesis
MNLAVNLRLYVKGEIGGIENYVRNVIAGIAANQKALNADWTVFAHESQIAHVAEIAPGARIVPVIHETATRQIEQELERGRYDLLFCPLLVLDPLRVKVPSAVTVPDLQHEFFPEFFDHDTLHWRRQTFRPSVHHANAVFTISEYSKKTIVDRFGIDPGKLTVVGLDVDEEFRKPTTAEAAREFLKLNLPSDYLYYPANFWPHKNHSNLLSAVKLLTKSLFPNLHLVLTGAPSTGADRIKAEIAGLGLKSHVHLLSYQSRAVIAEIYRHARALAFVSRFEGFGIPLLEAFHTGTPAVTSRAASCPEVAAGAAVLVDEMDPESIAHGIRSLLEDADLARTLVQKGHARATRYSWANAIETTLQTFDKITSARRNPIHVEITEYPVVSVVTPSYQMAHFLEETIQSVLGQDYPRIDHIVMDGGSTDGTLEILRKYEGRLRYSSGPDGGQSDAINRGFEISRGQIFTFLNADDTYLPGAVSTAVKSMLARKDVGLVYGDAYHVHEDGSIMGPYPTRPYDYESLSRNCYICQPASFMWRDVFLAVGGINKKLHIALDYDLWMRIAKLYPLMKIDGFLATSRMYRENKTVSKRRLGYLEIMSCVREHYGYIPYDWVYGYSAYLLDRKDQIFEATRPSLPKLLLTLLLGSCYNNRQPVRYWKDFGKQLGIGAKFTGRYDDGWIAKKYVTELDGAADCERITIAGRHLAPFIRGFKLAVRMNGTFVDKVEIVEHGPFTFDVKCPAGAGEKPVRLVLECSKSFRPVVTGDYRELSCIIDTITVGKAQSQAR